MKRLGLAAVPLMLILALAIAGCGKQVDGNSSGGGNTAQPNTISMTSDNFTIHAITVKAGTAVHFEDPATGGTHVLCLGKDETCDKSAAGPSELKDPGFTINAGDPTKDITFADPGTYDVTCTVHQNMNVTITVQ